MTWEKETFPAVQQFVGPRQNSYQKVRGLGGSKAAVKSGWLVHLGGLVQ